MDSNCENAEAVFIKTEDGVDWYQCTACGEVYCQISR